MPSPEPRGHCGERGLLPHAPASAAPTQQQALLLADRKREKILLRLRLPDSEQQGGGGALWGRAPPLRAPSHGLCPALSRCAALGGGHSAFPGCHPLLPDPRFPALCQEILSGSSTTVSTRRPLHLQRPILCCLWPDTTLAAAEGGVGLGRCPHSPHCEEPRHSGLSRITPGPLQNSGHTV